MKITKVYKDKALGLLYQMMRIRRLEEKSAEMYTREKIRGFLHLYTGEEAVAAGIHNSIKAEDVVYATYREHGHALMKGIPAGAIIAEMYGKVEGCSKGRGGSMHLFDSKLKFHGGSAIVAGHIPMAAGHALAYKMQKKSSIACAIFGEGAVAEGEFHETMNMAALWELPVLFICENNLYAMGTALSLSESNTDISAKAASYGIKSAFVDGMDVLEVDEAAEKASEYIRKTRKPYFLECRAYRFNAHSMFDAELYREKLEVAEWKKRDPIMSLYNKLINESQITKSEFKTLQRQVEDEMDEAVRFAEKSNFEPVTELYRHVYSDKKGTNSHEVTKNPGSSGGDQKKVKYMMRGYYD